MVEGTLNSSKRSKKFIVKDTRGKKNGFINPVIVNFQNGDLVDGSDFNVTLTPNTNGKTNVEITSSTGHVYKETNFNKMGRSKQFIVIRNRKTNKVKVIEVDNALLMNSALLSSAETEQETSKSLAQEIKHLNKTFGGKKVVNRLEQKEKLNLSSLHIADEVKNAVQNIKVNENVSLNDAETESLIDLLPPCHRDATSLSQVYVLSEILSEEELEALKAELSSLDESKFSLKEYSPFFMDCYAEAKKSQNNVKTNLAAVLFAESIIKFLKIQSKKLSAKKPVLCAFSSVIQNKLLSEFCIRTDTSITRPLSMRDKSLCYVIALGLISCNYKINLKLLSTSTSVHLSKLTRLARAVGAVSVPKQENMCALKLPLPNLPKASSGKIRRT